jgi:hypothetical protein
MGNIENMTVEQLREALAVAKAENNKLKGRPNTIKVSEKGAVSVYGLQKFPVTLYAEQWEKLLAMADAIREFIGENKASLKTKAESKAEQAVTPAAESVG